MQIRDNFAIVTPLSCSEKGQHVGIGTGFFYVEAGALFLINCVSRDPTSCVSKAYIFRSIMFRIHRAAWFVVLISCFTGALGPAEAAAPAPSMSAQEKRESASLYLQIHQVLIHPRCLNCHPKGDSPKQGNVRRIHTPPITRGPHDNGPAGVECAACHQQANYAASGVPGAPNWHLAPISMAWEDKTPGELCRVLLDKRTNGNRDLKATVRHLTQDKLVAWGWEPGTDVDGRQREPVPIAKAEFNRIVNAWARLGAACPE